MTAHRDPLGRYGEEAAGPLLGVRYAMAKARPDAVIDEAREVGRDTVAVTYVVPAGVVAAADHLEILIAESDEFCANQRLITLARCHGAATRLRRLP